MVYGEDDAIRFIFTDHNKYDIIMDYWSIYHGGHPHRITYCQNGRLHGVQYTWFPIQQGGHYNFISNYQNGQEHGTLYGWWSNIWGCHQMCIKNYQNDQLHGVQHHWREDGSYYTEVY
jgi:antitoxin component YwqK of YwqJK toxin-antitoxin module